MRRPQETFQRDDPALVEQGQQPNQDPGGGTGVTERGVPTLDRDAEARQRPPPSV